MGTGQLVLEKHIWPRMNIFQLLLLVQLSDGVCSIPLVNCRSGKPVPLVHKYYQPGDLIIAGIISQIFTISDQITFRRHPSEELVDELM